MKVTYDFKNKVVGCVDIFEGNQLYIQVKEDWMSNTEHMKYEFPMRAVTAFHFEFKSGWKPSNGLIRNARSVGLDIMNSQYQAVQRFIGITSLGNENSNDPNTKHWDGQLLELFNPEIDYIPFIKKLDRNNIFHMSGVNPDNIRGTMAIPSEFLTQEYIYKEAVPEKYPELFL